jgi:hypothetical protein
MGYALPPPFTFPKNNRTGCTQIDNLLLLSHRIQPLLSISMASTRSGSNARYSRIADAAA